MCCHDEEERKEKIVKEKEKRKGVNEGWEEWRKQCLPNGKCSLDNHDTAYLSLGRGLDVLEIETGQAAVGVAVHTLLVLVMPHDPASAVDAC